MPEPEWVPFDKDFQYEKVFYDVKVGGPNGTEKIYYQCWPNAGRLHCTDHNSRTFTITDGVMVRPS